MRIDWTRPAALGDALHGLYLGPPVRGPLAGGRTAALARLHAYDPARYGTARNFLDGPVSGLSAYLRHGMLTAPEVRDHVRGRFAGQPRVIEEFLRQLAWRDFFEHVLDWHGPAVHADLEPPKHAVRRDPDLPADVAAGRTGLPCVDGMLAGLFADGYLHNHERLWFAAYLCHFRGVDWTAGARLFRQYLYDGDVATNSCSWQWVEGTFAAKPYFMNKENVAHYSAGRWCRGCTAKCPFDAGYDRLQATLFGGPAAPLSTVRGRSAAADTPATDERPPAAADPATDDGRRTTDTLVWVHDAALSPEDIALKTFPTAAAAFVFDEPALRAEPWAFHRLAFVFDGVCELFAGLPHPVKEVRVGDPVAELTAVARAVGATTVAVTDSPNPWVRDGVDRLGRSFAVRVLPRPRLTEYADEPRRFSKYWQRAARQVLGYTPASSKKPMR